MKINLSSGYIKLLNGKKAHNDKIIRLYPAGIQLTYEEIYKLNILFSLNEEHIYPKKYGCDGGDRFQELLILSMIAYEELLEKYKEKFMSSINKDLDNKWEEDRKKLW